MIDLSKKNRYKKNIYKSDIIYYAKKNMRRG